MTSEDKVEVASNPDTTTQINQEDFARMERSFVVLNEFFRKQHDLIKEKYRISALEMELIQFVIKNGPQKMKAVAESFHIKLSTLTSVIDKAEKQRILKRVNSKDDRRVVFLDATKRGKNIYQEYTKHLRELVLRMKGSLDDETFAHFVQGIETFTKISLN